MRVDRAAWDEETSPGSDLHSTGDTPTNEPLGKLIDGLMFNEVQRLQLMLQEANMTVSQTESALHEQCNQLQEKVYELQTQLNAQSPQPESPALFRSFDSLHTDALEDTDEEFWELALLPDENEPAEVAACRQIIKFHDEDHEKSNAAQSGPLDDSAMDSEGSIESRLKLVKISSCITQEQMKEELCMEDSGQLGLPPGSQEEAGNAQDDDDSSSTYSAAHEDGAGNLQSVGSFADGSTLGGYTFGRADMQRLISEGDALKLVVEQVSAALEQVDDDKHQLEDYLRTMIETRTLSLQQTQNSPSWAGSLPRQIHQISAKHESLYAELLRRLDQSRSALQQSTETQHQLRTEVDALRAAGDTMRNALSATEAEMKLYQDMIGVMKCDDEGNAGKLEDIHQRLQSVEAWRLRAKKMVETTATVLPDMQKHFQHLDQTSTSHISEILLLREENRNLTTSLAEMSIKFAEADSQHLETKRALARCEQRLQEVLAKATSPSNMADGTRDP